MRKFQRNYTRKRRRSAASFSARFTSVCGEALYPITHTSTWLDIKPFTSRGLFSFFLMDKKIFQPFWVVSGVEWEGGSEAVSPHHLARCVESPNPSLTFRFLRRTPETVVHRLLGCSVFFRSLLSAQGRAGRAGHPSDPVAVGWRHLSG